MKILTAIPIHVSKDYCAERWFENVFKLEYPADLLLVDNSPGTDYAEKLKKYCSKYGINPVRSSLTEVSLETRDKVASETSYGVKNYKIEHLELPLEQGKFERIARSREVIRREVLDKGYDGWFSWENDQLIPTNTLGELVKMMRSADFSMVELNGWDREIPNFPNFDWGVALISRGALEKYSFILEFGKEREMPGTGEPGEAWFRKRVLRGGGSCLQADGTIGPIYHLNE